MPPEFLRGTAAQDECASLFEQYKTCLQVSLPRTSLPRHHPESSLQKSLKERGIDTMLKDAMEDAREADAEHLANKPR